MVILITGTSRGIGKKLAEHYLSLGHTVIGCSRSEGSIKEDGYFHFICDLTDEASILEFCKSVKQSFKTIDCLINNAGSASMNHFLLTPRDTAEQLIKVNYLSGFSMVRCFSGMLKKSEHPRVVNFSSVAVPLHLEGELAYGVAKSAVESMTRVLAKELAHLKITVNAIGPAPTRTDLIAKVPEDKIQRIIDAQAVKRFAEFEDICNVVDFYISPASDFITGQVIYLGGIMG